MKKISIDIVSDIVCPWCYIGVVRLIKAIEAEADMEAELKWHPFQLNPQMPQEGRNHQEFFEEKFGSKERAESIMNNTSATAAADGLQFNFSKLQTAPNTMLAHRLLWLASVQEKGKEMAMALYNAYFTEGKNIGNIEELTQLGLSLGYSREDLDHFFESESGLEEVKEEEKQFKEMGIMSVPTFIIENKYLITGARNTEDWKTVFEKIRQE